MAPQFALGLYLFLPGRIYLFLPQQKQKRQTVKKNVLSISNPERTPADCKLNQVSATAAAGAARPFVSSISHSWFLHYKDAETGERFSVTHQLNFGLLQ